MISILQCTKLIYIQYFPKDLADKQVHYLFVMQYNKKWINDKCYNIKQGKEIKNIYHFKMAAKIKIYCQNWNLNAKIKLILTSHNQRDKIIQYRTWMCPKFFLLSSIFGWAASPIIWLILTF